MNALPMPELAEHAGSGVRFLTDDALFDATGIRIAFTMRHGGYSAAPFESLNLGSHVGDDLEAVHANRRLLLKAMGASKDCDLITLNQVHGTRVIDFPSQPMNADLVPPEADAIVVTRPDEAALLCFADCVPLIFAAPTGAFAIAHAGWRGVINNIAAPTIASLSGQSGCQPKDMNAYIGPHIHEECFEVSKELAQQFADRFGDDVVAEERHVNLAKAIKKTLLEEGIEAPRICDAGICTVCSKDDFFSYRAENRNCGRHGAIAFRVA